jgi:PKD repeat protein
MARSNFALASAGLLVLLAAAGCTAHKTTIPALTGPSDVGTSISVRVTPDTIFWDGASQSLVTVTAFDINGQPVRNLTLRAEVMSNGVMTDSLGTLSARNIVTDSTGKATLTFTAPPPPSIVIGSGTIVSISVTPTGSDFSNAVPRAATIRLVPPGTIGAPPSPLRPEFAAPSSVVGDSAVFSATVTDPSNANADASTQVASYLWNFGDGGSASGRTVTHTYTRPGIFAVNLTITDFLGRVAPVSHSVTVTAGVNPTAKFVTSPASPIIGQAINFNASGSIATPGHVLTDYAWSFGDGTFGSGPIITHSYTFAGTYTVTLTVTDDAGRKSDQAQQPITVTNGNPIPDFTFNPSAPRSGQQVTFDASGTQAAAGRTIVSYSWSFGNGLSGSGQTVTTTFTTGTTPTTFNVLLTVTDSAGKTSSITKPITVNP